MSASNARAITMYWNGRDFVLYAVENAVIRGDATIADIDLKMPENLKQFLKGKPLESKV